METGQETPLKRILREEGRKQAWLAERIGVSATQMSYWVNGLHCPEEKREAIAAALGRTVDEVFPREVPA
jgi:transcriptional regulator with XRE-family HTH domain